MACLLFLARTLVILLSITGLCFSQETVPIAPAKDHKETPVSKAAQAPTASQLPRSIQIVTLEGEGAVNSISARSVTQPVVEVRNENELPIEGATVTFELPAFGPGGTFPGGQRTLTTVSNSRGQAMARGFQINNLPGVFTIHVTAIVENLKATHSITQTNTMKLAAAGPRKSRKWLWITLTGMAAGGAAAAVLLTRDTTSTIAVSPGSAVFGPPN